MNQKKPRRLRRWVIGIGLLIIVAAGVYIGMGLTADTGTVDEDECPVDCPLYPGVVDPLSPGELLFNLWATLAVHYVSGLLVMLFLFVRAGMRGVWNRHHMDPMPGLGGWWWALVRSLLFCLASWVAVFRTLKGDLRLRVRERSVS